METSDEYKRIINEEMFLSIRRYMLQKKSSDKIIAKIEELLSEGADVNALDNKNNNNTLLHIAAQHGDEQIVKYLLQKGARVICNKKGNFADDCALRTNSAIIKELAVISSKEKLCGVSSTDKTSRKQMVSKQTHENNINILRPVSVQEMSYSKRAGTSGVSGQFYETKLLSLVLHRALHDKDIEEFYLAANIKDIGDFDDVCFRYGNVACFMQTKHRENINTAKLSVASVRSNTGKLGLGIYYDSFLKIKQKFSPNSKDPMFEGKFEDLDCYFILYTPLKESFDKKVSGNKPICSKMHDIINTSETKIDKNKKGIDIFQFDYEEYDLNLLTNFIKREHIKNLGKTFLDLILSKNKLEVIMADNLIKIYHPALAQKVISISRIQNIPKLPKTLKNPKYQSTPSLYDPDVPSYVHKAMFRPTFFYSEDYDLIILKDTLCKEIVLTHSSKTELSKEQLRLKINEIAENPCAYTISTLIGSPIKFDDNNDKLILDSNKLPKNKYKQEDIQEIRYDLQKIQVTRAMVRDAIYLAGQRKLQHLIFQLPQSFGNIDLTTNKKSKKDVEERLDFLADKFFSLINYFAKRNENKEIKVIEINSDVVGPGKILEFTHLNSNGGIGGAVGNLLKFDAEKELFTFNTTAMLKENGLYVLNKLKYLTRNQNVDLSKYQIIIRIDGFPRVSFDIYQYDKNIAVEFLSKLWFYTNQAQEESVETTLKKEINTYYSADKQRHQFHFHVHSDAIFLRFHDEIQKWWKKQTDAPYLTKNTLILERAKKGIVDSPVLTVLNVMFIRKIKHLGIEFNENAIDCLSINECMDKHKHKILNIVSDAVMLSAAKIMQSNKYQNNYSLINLDYVHVMPQIDYETMMDELKVIKDTRIVIISETPVCEGLQDTLLNIFNSYTEHRDTLNKQMIIITGEPLQYKIQNVDQYIIKDNNVNLKDLTTQSQTFFLDKCTITYQGQEVKLNVVVDKNSKRLIKAKLLWSLLNREKMEIGHAFDTHKYDEIKNYYINRKLKKDDEEIEVSTFDDLDENIVLISSKPCMGKTILLTHMSLETKKVNPKPWIVQINMSLQDKHFESLREDNIESIMTFLCNAALKKPDEIYKVNFTEIDTETIAIINKDGKEVSFELQLFINYYNSGNIIFLFDGFDKIYPHNTDEGIILFKALKNANKRMWITSDCYVINILEDEFGQSYKLERLSTLQQKSFLQRFWSTNLKLEKLNHDQCNNILLFVNYILKMFKRELNLDDDVNERPIMPMLSVPIHIIYLTILDYFKHEVHSLSPRYIREKLKRKFKLDSYSAVDHYLGRSSVQETLELAGTPLHMYIAANYFAFQITDKFDFHLDTKLITDKLNVYVNAVTLYERFLKVNIKNICEIENKAAVGDDQTELRDNFFESHKKLALYAICKESDITKILTQSEIRDIKKIIRKIESNEIKTPFIDTVVDGIPRFYHLLFAEYFIVETLTDLLKRMKNNDFDDLKMESFWDFLVNVVLVTSPPGLRNSFEYKLKYDPEVAEAANCDNNRKVLFDLLVKPNQIPDVTPPDTDNALNIAFKEGLVHITNFLLNGIGQKVSGPRMNQFKTVLQSSATILSIVDSSRSIVNENVLQCMHNMEGETIVEVLNTTEAGICFQEAVKTAVVEPAKILTEKILEASGNNKNIVRLATLFPFYIVDFMRQVTKK